MASQEKEIREKLITPLGLKVDEARHIVRDTYTGLEFKERPVLNRILELAKHGEFDVLCMDVLDRLGREGIAREIYRAQLRELGIRTLTTKPEEHADDDSSIGEIIRILHGFKAKEELEDIRRRTMHGKRAKVEGLETDGSIGQKKIIGTGLRLYGYKYILNDRGKRIGYDLNLDVILVDEDGTQWTEVKVVIFIFESAATGMSYPQIARVLNEKGIQPPYLAKGGKARYKGKPAWQKGSISRIVNESGYYGELAQFKTKSLPRGSRRTYPRRPTTDTEQIIVPIPVIVTKELALAAQKRAQRNQQYASRNNRHPEESLLRVGLIKCGHCGGNMTLRRNYRRNTNAFGYYPNYVCIAHTSQLEKCPIGSRMASSLADTIAWQKAVEIINDPVEVDAMVNSYRSSDPTAERRKHTNKKLADIRKALKNLEDNTTRLAQQGLLHPRLAASFHKQAEELTAQEQECQELLAKEMDAYATWLQVEAKLDELHQRCQVWREKLKDPQFIPPYGEKRELCEFFGITIICYRKGHVPPYETEVSPPSIVSLLSSLVGRPTKYQPL
jgi:site-specific DNA recombinase